MKKKNAKRRLLLILVILLVYTMIPTSCDSGVIRDNSSDITTESDDFFNDISYLKFFTADINLSTTAVGLIENSSSSRSLDSHTNYLLVKVDEGESEPEPVTFKATEDLTLDGRSIKAGDVVSQDVLFGSVDKVYVTEDYTLISFLTADVLGIVNRKETVVKNNDSYISYSGTIERQGESDPNGGWTDSVHYEFFDAQEDTILLRMTHNKWWFDSSGNKLYDITEKDETLTLRCDYNNVQAKNEYSEVSMYDTFDYYTSDFRQSFIIDNDNGYIYEIPKMDGEDGLNLSIHMGVIIDSKLGPVKLSINQDGELVIEQLLANPSISINDVFRDIYGQYYIRTDSLSEIDGNVVFYIARGEYVPTQDGRVLHISYNHENTLNQSLYSEIEGLSIVGNNYQFLELNSNEELNINYDLEFCHRGIIDYNQGNGIDNSHESLKGARGHIEMAKGGYMDCYLATNMNYCSIRYSISTGETQYIRFNGRDNSYRFFNLPGIYAGLAIQEANNAYTVYYIDPYSYYFSNGSFEKGIVHSDGTKEELINTSIYDESIGMDRAKETEAVFKFAEENNMTKIYDAYSTGSYVSPLPKYSEYISLDDGKYLVISDDYTFSEVKRLYYETLSENVTKLLDSVKINWTLGDDGLTMVFTEVGLNTNNYYQIVKKEDVFDVLNIGTSVYQVQRIRLQPLLW